MGHNQRVNLVCKNSSIEAATDVQAACSIPLQVREHKLSACFRASKVSRSHRCSIKSQVGEHKLKLSACFQANKLSADAQYAKSKSLGQ